MFGECDDFDNRRRNFEVKVWCVIAVTVITFITILRGASLSHDRLMDQCISDGHKEYECVAMLRHARR